MPKPPKHVVISKKELGARLRALRLARGMTQAEVADAIGAHFTVVSSVERGVRALTLQQVVKLAAALKMSPDALLHREGTPAEPAPTRRDGRLLRRIERIRELPAAQQRTVLDVLDSLLKTHSSAGAGQGRTVRPAARARNGRQRRTGSSEAS